ncbi:hypothetical protein [Crenobacter intestini]|uniref:Uncharacterized protein n=1 Tax=Crenobacter intestini TaxID=2563443 RepID=A0A4T0UJE5_9NEIS|nr:hypothetical protein [Crenobacter intestini]TIC78662.1 hypothetical protein E5K04_15300 [Crenobacter intestini]
MKEARSIAGMQFGRLTAVGFLARHPAGRQFRHLWAFDCGCGQRVVLFKDDVLKGRVHSCGCARKGSVPGANDRSWLLEQAAASTPWVSERPDRDGHFIVRRQSGRAPAIPSLFALLSGICPERSA